MRDKTLTIIVPVNNEDESIDLFLNALSDIDLPVRKDVLFVDDGSTDKTVSMIDSLIDGYPSIHVGYLSLSRNFGKEAAMYAGLEHAVGDYVAFMDVDLQDPVTLLPEMVLAVMAGEYDVVAAKRIDRKHEGWLRSKLSDSFYWVMNKLSGITLEKGERDFRVMNRMVADSLLRMGESKRFSKGLFHWVGFRVKYLAYPNEARHAGTSSWGLIDLMVYAIDGIVSFSMKPLLIVSLTGMFLFLLSLVAIGFVAIRAIINPGVSAFGWTSMVSIMLFVSGLQLMSLGVIGKYIADIFIETKHRPQYIIKAKKE